MERRTFVKSSLLVTAPFVLDFYSPPESNLKLSLSQWSLHRTFFGNSKADYAQWQQWLASDPDQVLQGTLDPLQFPQVAKTKYGFDAVEYVNTFFFRKKDNYFKELRKNSDNHGVKNLLIMVDEEGFLGDPDAQVREKVIQRHGRWLEAAAILGCHSIRVNAHSKGTPEEQQKYSAEGLSALCDLAKPYGLDILIENHGGMSSDPNWLVETIEATDKSNIGTMVDFDNFQYSETKIWDGAHTFDRYEGVALLMPYAKSVSAKAFSFDEHGEEETIDFKRMFDIVKDADFKGFIGVEYEGDTLSEDAGIKTMKKLVEKYI